jgi:ubiquinone/menaquinone biosynthesis C-methylase UbiE
MIEQGRRLFPAVTFQVEDFFSLCLLDASVQAVVAYYAFVNDPLAEVEPALREARRVLKPGGLFLFTFHALEREEQVTLQTYLDTAVEGLTFHFFDPDRMRTLVEGVGFQVLDVLVRHPYPDVEYASKRAYFVLRRP